MHWGFSWLTEVVGIGVSGRQTEGVAVKTRSESGRGNVWGDRWRGLSGRPVCVCEV